MKGRLHVIGGGDPNATIGLAFTIATFIAFRASEDPLRRDCAAPRLQHME
jgi:hypothetical protein